MTQQIVPTSEYDRGVEAGRAEMLSLIETVQTVAPDLLPRLGPRPTLARLAEILPGYDASQLAILRPFDKREALALKEAADLAGRSESTVREWIIRFGVGRNVVGSTMVSAPALMMLLDDDALALGCLLMGLRDHPTVRPYMERTGIRMAAQSRVSTGREALGPL